jgi:serine/threonine protein kinase
MFLWDNFKIIHRDIKPENIFITDDDIVILIDFGVARRIMTSFVGNTNVGTPDYKAPEYYRGEMI